MSLDTTVLLLASLGGSGIVALVVSLLRAPSRAAAEALAAKTTAEIRHLVSLTDSENNHLLHSMVLSLMHYAEVHSDDVLKDFHSKAEFVKARIEADPRFAGMGVGLDAVEALIEFYFAEVFVGLKAADPAAPAA